MTDPTDEQLLATVDAVSVTLPPLPMDHTDAHGRINYDIAWRIAMARAVLAQWGGQAAPVPVSERLPGPEDCDAEGRCWIHQPHEACPEAPAWELMSAKYASANYGAVCWLPANTLPLPTTEPTP